MVAWYRDAIPADVRAMTHVLDVCLCCDMMRSAHAAPAHLSSGWQHAGLAKDEGCVLLRADGADMVTCVPPRTDLSRRRTGRQCPNPHSCFRSAGSST